MPAHTLVTPISDVTDRGDNRKPWTFATVLRRDADGGLVTDTPRPVYPEGGVLTVDLVPGYVEARHGNKVFHLNVPDELDPGTTLGDLIADGLAFPPETDAERLNEAVRKYVENNRLQFGLRAVPINSGPNAGKAQWQDGFGNQIGAPVTWDQVISTAVAQAAAAAATPDVVSNYVAGQGFEWSDNLDGTGSLAIAGVPLPGTLQPAAQVYSNVTGAEEGVNDVIARNVLGPGMLSIKSFWFGAVGDGIADDQPALLAALASGHNIYIPAGDYNIGSMVTTAMSDTTVLGQSGARIISSTLSSLLNLRECVNVAFENLIFEVTTDNAVETNSHGLIRNFFFPWKNVKFKDCRFTCAARATNAVKVMADGLAEFAVDDILFDRCIFERCGRMGLEVTDQTNNSSGGDPTIRVRNFRVENSRFIDCGNLASSIGLSFCGRMLGCVSRNNHFEDIAGRALEFAGDHQYGIAEGNTFARLGDGCYPISASNNTNQNYNFRFTMALNKTLDRTGLGVYLDYMDEGRFSYNVFVTKGNAMDIRSSRRCRGIGELYDGGNRVAMWVEGRSGRPCEKNEWLQSDFRIDGASEPWAAVRFYGEYSTGNKIRSSRIVKGPTGGFVDQINNAYGNELWSCEIGSNAYAASASIALSDADKTIRLDEADVEMVNFTGSGLTATRTVNWPRSRRVQAVRNSTPQALIMSVPGITTSTITIPPGATVRFGINDTALAISGAASSATATLNFPSIAAFSTADLTITLAGAAVGDVVAPPGVPVAAQVAGMSYTAFVSAANTVTVRAINNTAGAIDPASGSFKVAILR